MFVFYFFKPSQTACKGTEHTVGRSVSYSLGRTQIPGNGRKCYWVENSQNCSNTGCCSALVKTWSSPSSTSRHPRLLPAWSSSTGKQSTAQATLRHFRSQSSGKKGKLINLKTLLSTCLLVAHVQIRDQIFFAKSQNPAFLGPKFSKITA